MKKIFIVTSRLLDGGTATVSFNYYIMLKNRGFNVNLVVLENLPISNKYKIEDGDVVELKLFDGKKSVLSLSNCFNMIKAFRNIAHILRSDNATFIFVHFLPVFVSFPFWFFKKESSYFIHTIHTNIFSFMKGLSSLKKLFFRLFIFCLKCCDKLVFLTPDVADKYKSAFGSSDKVCSIPNFFKPNSQALEREVSQFGFKDFILYSGRLSKEKNLDFLIDSYYSYLQKGGTKKLIIAGDGPMHSVLEQKVFEMNLTQYVFLLGHVNFMTEIYRSASYLILLSDYEGFGMVLLEAIYFNKPVLVSNCSSGPSYILERKNPNELPTFHQNGLGILLPKPGIANEDDYSSSMLLMENNAICNDERDRCLYYFSEDNIYKKWLEIILP